MESADGPLVTRTAIVEDLRELDVEPGMVLVVHSSLDSLGWVCGGPQTVIRALETAVGREGTVVMPTHTWHLTDPAVWSEDPVPEEWWPAIREEMPAYRRDSTPSRGMGAIPEAFRARDEVRRSRHPHVSFAASGRYRDRVVDDHTFPDSLGERSPVGRIYELGGYVLLLGVDHSVNSSLHLAEYRWSGAGDRRIVQSAPVQEGGWRKYRDIQHDDSDFAAIGRAYRAERGGGAGEVGAAAARLVHQPSIVDFAEDWMEENREA